MPKPSKFDANKLRDMITENKSAQEMLDTFGVKKPMLKSFLAKLMMIDKKFYEINGLESRAVSSSPKVTKYGLKISLSLLESYGFKLGDTFKFLSSDGNISLEKI